MMVSFSYIDKTMPFANARYPVLVVENKQLFRNIISSFDCNEPEEYFTFSEDHVPFVFSKEGFFISDIFDINLNNKKLLARINTYLEENANIEFSAETEQLIADFISFGDKLRQFADFDCNFSYDINARDIIKLLQFRLGDEQCSPMDDLVSFMLLMSKYLRTRVFVVPHIHLLFDTEEIALLYDTLSLNHINMLSIECVAPDNRCDYEEFFILDNDLCFIDN